MRLYYMTSERWGLSDLTHRHLKISRIDDLNDPFELLSAHLGEKKARAFHRQIKKIIADRWGLLCFSKTWQSPVMWAHYGEKHRGLCLGFDVLEAKPVSYAPDRLLHELEGGFPPKKLDAHERLVEASLSTKYKEWEYEQEYRIFARLEEAGEDGNFYKGFEDEDWIFLREVIIGERSRLTPAEVARAVGKANSKSVRVFKARAAFTKYEVVQDKSVMPVTVKAFGRR